MSEIKVLKKDKVYFISEIAKIIKTGNDSKLVAEFLEGNKNILSDGEFIKVDKVELDLPDDFVGFGLLTPHYEYSINIKKTTIIIVALLLDLNFTKGFASFVSGITGLSAQTIKKIDQNNKCLLAEIHLKKNCNKKELDFEQQECVWNNIKCEFKNERNICNRSLEEIELQISKLLDEKIIEENNGKLKICF